MNDKNCKKTLTRYLCAYGLGSAMLTLCLTANATPSVTPDGAELIKVPSKQSQFANTPPKQVGVMKFKLNHDAKQALANRIDRNQRRSFHLHENDKKLPSKIDLGMNHTPVLDQGQHGSCVTFATTGAIDAAMGQGDYVSQLCLLELGRTLEEKSFYPSGWNGSLGEFVLNEIAEFGIVPKSHQLEHGCAGVKEYPLEDFTNEGNPMTLDEYHSAARNGFGYDFLWSPVLTIGDAFLNNFDGQVTVDKVKQSLVKGHRVAFASLLDIYELWHGGNGYYKNSTGFPDAWMMTPEIEEHLKAGEVDAGHEIVIYGYDDDAVIKGLDGRTQKGAFLIRNSWGKEAGHEGNYVMTYDHFKMMVMEAHQIIPSSEFGG